jgi:hypothetical protein
MLTVRVRLPTGEIVPRIDDMRAWLNVARFELLMFRCAISTDAGMVEAAFGAEDEAEAFADQFGGTVFGRSPQSVGQTFSASRSYGFSSGSTLASTTDTPGERSARLGRGAHLFRSLRRP